MKKGVILKVISIAFALITILAIACAITVTGSGFLDLSNIVRAVCIGVAIICGILAFITWKWRDGNLHRKRHTYRPPFRRAVKRHAHCLL